MTSTPAAIEVTNLYKRYGPKVAVDGLSLRIEEGQTVGILGTNGAGKTTTVETIAGLRTPDRGTVSVFGLDPSRDRRRLPHVLGVQLQDAYLHNALTAAELVELYRSFYPRPRGAEETLEMVELTDHRDTQFEKLSGGQRQRLSVALALIGRPRAVILDELTTGLDPRARRRMWSAVERLKEQGVTVVLVSHAMEEVERLCDEVLILDAGRVIARDTPAGLVKDSTAGSLEDVFVELAGKELEEAE